MNKFFNFTLAVYLLIICTPTIADKSKPSDNIIVLTPIVVTPGPIAADKPTISPPITATPPQMNEWVKIETTATTAKAINPQTLANRSYYAMPADAMCIANNDPKRTKLKTWRNKLSFNNKGQMLIWESICNDSPRLMAWSKLENGSVLITTDLSHINYTGQIFTYFATPPLLCATGSWCPVDKQ